MSGVLRGIGASSGVVIAPALLLEKHSVGVYQVSLANAEAVDAELERFRHAQQMCRNQLHAVQDSLRERVGEHYAVIFDAQLLLLEDPSFVGEVENRIRSERVNVEWALQETVSRVRELFRELEDPYIRERVGDVEDLYERMLLNLAGKGRHDLSELEEDRIIVSHNLNPSDTASLSTKHVVGFVTDMGGRTSHTAILARSLEVPAVVGLRVITAEVKTGDLLILDGEEGLVHVNPSEHVIDAYRTRHLKELERERLYLKTRDVPAETLDGQEIRLRANIELPEEIVSTIEYGAQGIGLYRSEFLFLEKSPDLPTEEDHERLYRMLVEKVSPQPTVVRTIDLGGEKYYHEVLEPDETNPVMGLRGIRLSLRRKELFRTQLRGALRASVAGDLRLMFPMVSGCGELDEALAYIDSVKDELRAEGVDFREDIPIGIMVEVPSAALIAEHLARRVDFLSIGTNDLIQYTLAVDRMNEEISYLYQPMHPAVLRLVRGVVKAGESTGTCVSLCGEMAANPVHAVVLMGLGVREFSMNPVAVPKVKAAVRSIELREAEEIAMDALQRGSASDVEAMLQDRLSDKLHSMQEAQE